MLKKLTSLVVLFGLILSVHGQNEAIVQEGELGISVGAGHYFGDINNQSRFNNAKPVMGVFFSQTVWRLCGFAVKRTLCGPGLF